MVDKKQANDIRLECWNIINAAIEKRASGELKGNGCDDVATLNGLVLAANLILQHIETN